MDGLDQVPTSSIARLLDNEQIKPDKTTVFPWPSVLRTRTENISFFGFFTRWLIQFLNTASLFNSYQHKPD